MYCVYEIKHKETEKKYFGFSGDFDKRMNYHRNANGNCTKIHNAIRKYGWDAFDKQVVFITNDYDVGLLWEEYLIRKHKTQEYGYNLSSGGKQSKHSEESKRKISKNNARTGKPRSDRTKKKISDGVKRYIEKWWKTSLQ